MLNNYKIEYKIVTSADSADLANMITEHLNDGWNLRGSLAATVNVYKLPMYAQAIGRLSSMAKEEESE